MKKSTLALAVAAGVISVSLSTGAFARTSITEVASRVVALEEAVSTKASKSDVDQAIAEISLTQGPQGQTGAQGDQGERGIQGLAGTNGAEADLSGIHADIDTINDKLADLADKDAEILALQENVATLTTLLEMTVDVVDFTKISVSGSPLTSSAKNWSCVRDNVTGLVWEVKTAKVYGEVEVTDLHSVESLYRGTGEGVYPYDGGYTGSDWHKFVRQSNSEGHCGFKDWRLPSKEELVGATAPYPGTRSVKFMRQYFPRAGGMEWSTTIDWYGGMDNGWTVDFSSGDGSSELHRDRDAPVRLVRGGQ
jgi:hypothetical protein